MKEESQEELFLVANDNKSKEPTRLDSNKSQSLWIKVNHQKPPLAFRIW